jgi:HK97 family phage prohead protease
MNVAVRKAAADQKTRPVPFQPSSFDGENRTVEAVIATETPVQIYRGVAEVLLNSPSTVNTARLIGAPLLDSHNRSSIDNVIGRIEKFRFEGRKLVATIRFDTGRRAEEALAKVRDGMIGKVSVGYQIDEFEETRASDGTRVQTATMWTPFEVSLVGVPADPNAKIRGLSRMKNPLKRKIAVEAENLDDDLNLQDLDNDGDNQEQRRRSSPMVISRQVDRGIERVRQMAIDQGAAEADIDEAFENVTTAAEARERAFDVMAARSRTTLTNPSRENSRAREMDILHSRAADALAVRLGSPASAIKDNPMLGRSIAGIGREFLEGSGVSTRNMDDIKVIEAAFSTRSMHTTSDFSALFVDGGQRVLKEIYETTASPLIELSRKRNAKDFRPVSMIRPGSFPRHKKITESGEIQFGTFDIEKEAFSILSYAIAISITRQMLVNDDLNAFAEVLQGVGDSAVNDVGDLFYALISENAFGGRKLADGNNLFHASHGNLAGAGSALTVASLSAGRQAMRTQKGVDGKSNAGAAPSVLLVGPALETTAEQLVATMNAAAVSDVNPFSGKLSVKVENRYAGNGWWLFADPKSRPAFVHGYLDGEIEGPRLRSDQPFGRQGMSFSSEFDFGCGIYDHRAAYFNPGA